jgi:ABC-type phosphate transport system substrate-binding protein
MIRSIRNLLPMFGLSLSLSAQAQGDVVAVVSAKSSITRLSSSQLSDIFLGKVSRFPDGTLAVPVDLGEGSAERDQFYGKVVGKTPAQIKAYWSKVIFTGRGQPPMVVKNGREMKKYVAENTDAVGYIDSTLVDDSVRVLP